MNQALESCVGWAFTKSAVALRGEPNTILLVLVAFAHHADLEVNRPEGYTGTTTGQVAGMIGLSDATVRRYAKTLYQKGLLSSGAWTNMYRVPEQAFGNA